MMEHHPNYSPSSFPVLAICSSFTSSGDDDWRTEDRDLGTDCHKYLEALLTGINPAILEVELGRSLDLHSKEGIEWAADRIRVNMTSEFPLEVEKRLSLLGEDFEEVTFGTADVINGNRLWDLKTGDRKDDFYWLQIACYAAMVMQRTGFDEMECEILYSRYRQVAKFVITFDEAMAAVTNLISHLKSDEPKIEIPNQCCKWCGKFKECEAVARQTAAINEGREDWELENYHASKIKDPIEMAKAWKLAKRMKDWCSAVEHWAKVMMIEDGIPIPGLEEKTRSGKRYIDDVAAAFEALSSIGVTQEDFIAICSTPIGKLEELVVRATGLSKYKAGKELEEMLEIKRGKDSVFLAEFKPKSPKKKTKTTRKKKDA